MSEFETHRVIRCPLTQAALRLGEFFKEHGTADGNMVVLNVQVQFPSGDRPSIATLTKPVVATFTRVTSGNPQVPEYTVRWKPQDDGPYPEFHGELCVEADEDYNAFRLVLKGDYQPPFGIAGEIFDAALGRRLAKTTTAALLETIAESIQRNFDADELRKPVALKTTHS